MAVHDRKQLAKGQPASRLDQMGKRFCCFGAPHSREKKNGSRATLDSGVDLPCAPKNVRLFSYNELKSATQNFHQTNRIGRGGFGVVYKGMLRDDTQVAIKSLSAESKQGTNEFLTEIDMVSNVKHPNLVQLIGCCVEDRNRILVYEYLENNSLANALLGPKNKRIALDWPKRAAICVGTAHGLAFLHEEAEPHIVHRDIKASNVLLDKDLVPKIGDFGLAKLFPDNVTHISTRVAGTMGYLAPEYALLGQLTKKADIYSFGVLLLEMISGRSGSKSLWEFDMQTLLEWTWKLRDEDRLLDIVDLELVGGYPEQEVLRFVKVALFCTQATSNQRPSMKQVVEMLSDEEISLDVGNLIQPGVVKDTSQTPGNRSSSGRLANTPASITSTRNINSSATSMIEVQPR